MIHTLGYLCDRPWAITEAAMNSMWKFIQREEQRADEVAAKFRVYLEEPEKHSFDAAASGNERYLENTNQRVKLRGSTAVLPIDGPIFRKANIFTAISGAVSSELLHKDIQTALDDPQIDSLLFKVNSPGGEADGISELAGEIFKARGRKPIWAYVSGWAASGAYWLVSAADHIVMHSSGWAGSIGVIATINDDSKRRERDGYTKYEIVSSQSPLKRVDPATDEGQTVLKAMVDEMAAQFIDEVAAYRKTTAENVTNNFGKGFVIRAPKAIAAGMADETGTFEETVARLNSDRRMANVLSVAVSAVPAAATEAEEVPMAEEKQPDVNEARASAVAADRARISAILDCEEAKGREKLARHLALKTDMTPEAAREMLSTVEQPAAQPKAAQPDQFTQHMRTVANPQVGVATEQPDDTDAEVQRIVSYLPANQRRRAS